MSGGETEDAEAYRLMRQCIGAEADGYAVLALSWVASEQRWLYLIRTPFATWPKFAVGYTDRENAAPRGDFRLRLGRGRQGLLRGAQLRGPWLIPPPPNPNPWTIRGNCFLPYAGGGIACKPSGGSPGPMVPMPPMTAFPGAATR